MIPLSGRVSGRASGPSRSRDDDGGGLRYVSWKSVRLFRVFPSKGIYRRKGDVRGWTRDPHHLVVRLGGFLRHPMVRLPSVSHLDSVFVSGKYELRLSFRLILRIFPV
jgi:hypothetical protein